MDTNFFQREFNFFLSFLNHMHLDHHIYEDKGPFLITADLELRRTLGIDKKIIQAWNSQVHHIFKPNTIAYITDEFFCQYIIMRLPTEEPQILVIGPHVTDTLPPDQCLELLSQKAIPENWLPILKNYYQKLPCLPSEEGLITAIHTLADYLWGEDNYNSESIIQGLPNTMEPLAVPIDPQERGDAFSNLLAIEQMYQLENDMLQAVSHGRSAKAKSLFTAYPTNALEQRTETLRNLKNYCIVLNTLLRKAAEYGGVPPLYLNQLSSSFAYRIEALSHPEEHTELGMDMVQKYCALVNKHSMGNYSLPIQKVITRIDFDLTADLGLNATAEYLNVNASYLSQLFKKETGCTLTDYVNTKRMDHGAYLLTSTNLPISSIAQACGILDDNYFTKLFKRYQNETPTHFRGEHSILPR